MIIKITCEDLQEYAKMVKRCAQSDCHGCVLLDVCTDTDVCPEECGIENFLSLSGYLGNKEDDDDDKCVIYTRL